MQCTDQCGSSSCCQLHAVRRTTSKQTWSDKPRAATSLGSRSTEIDSPRRARGGTSAPHTSSCSTHAPLPKRDRRTPRVRSEATQSNVPHPHPRRTHAAYVLRRVLSRCDPSCPTPTVHTVMLCWAHEYREKHRWPCQGRGCSSRVTTLVRLDQRPASLTPYSLLLPCRDPRKAAAGGSGSSEAEPERKRPEVAREATHACVCVLAVGRANAEGARGGNVPRFST